MNKQKSFTKSAGFTLIELMIVIAIIGILAAIAIPQYQKYAVRSQVSQVLSAIRPMQLGIAEFALINSQLPGIGDIPGVPNDTGTAGAIEADTCNGIVRSVTYAPPAVGAAAGAPGTITAVFYTNNTAVAGTCGSNGATAAYTLPPEISAQTLVINVTSNVTGAVSYTIPAGATGGTLAPAYRPQL